MKTNHCDSAGRRLTLVVTLIGMLTMPITTARADEGRSSAESQDHQSTCLSTASHVPHGALEGIQVETSDLASYERFFSQVLRAPEVERIDHPQRDSLRSYCYRDVFIVVRQDLKSPRPTGWVQINFSVSDVDDVQRRLEQVLQESDLTKLSEEDRTKIVRLRFKPDVSRHNCKASRLEVGGPEGFMIGFDQFKEGSCSPDRRQTQKQPREHNQEHSQ